MDNPYIEKAQEQLNLVEDATIGFAQQYHENARTLALMAIAWEFQQIREAGLLPAINLWGHTMAGSGAVPLREGLIDE